MLRYAHPILSCAQSAIHEEHILHDDPTATYAAMTRAGEAVGKRLLEDYREYRPLSPQTPLRILTLCGTGHNGGDALHATRHILAAQTQATALVLLCYGRERLRPLAERSLQELEAGARERCKVLPYNDECLAKLAQQGPFDLCIEGIVGMQMRPPLRAPAPEILTQVNRLPIPLCAAVDLPAGLSDTPAEDGYKAHFTYTTGIAKAPLFTPGALARTGRIRYLDLDFFAPGTPTAPDVKRFILPPNDLAPLASLRPADCDKRSFGHLLLIGGSSDMPGAIAMATLAAARAGVGLLTTLTAAQHIPSLAAQIPEAMWRPIAIGSDGCLDPASLLKELPPLLPKASALAIGPGLKTNPELRETLAKIIRETPLPLLLDAGALCEESAKALTERPEHFPRPILTPHAGEFARMYSALFPQTSENTSDDAALSTFAQRTRAITLHKGPITRISDGEKTLINTHGGPILARGGSGDLLSGILGTLLARPQSGPLESAALGALWHGLAAEHLARERGQQAVRTTEILDHLAPVLRS